MIVVSGIVQMVNIGMTIFTEHARAPAARDDEVAEAVAPPVTG